MQEALFTPLGMTRTGIIYRTEFAANVADRYDADGALPRADQALPGARGRIDDHQRRDLARFVSALFAGKILKPQTRKAMLTPFIQLRRCTSFASSADEPEGTRSAPRSAWPTAWAGDC